MPAALIASMLKVAFASQAAHAHDPVRVLTGLNGALCGKFEEHFVTAAYLFVDLEKSLLHYSAAGHPPLMLASRAAGNVREIEENGLMLGTFPEAAYSSVEIRISPGDRCLLYTDGLFEAKNAAQEEFGKARCKEFLETQLDIPAARFANALLDNIAGFSGHNSARAQEDDITSSSSTFSRTLRSQEEFNPCDAESFKPWKQALQCRPANAAATLGVMIGTPARTPAPHTTHTRPARPAPTWPQKGCGTFPLRIAYPHHSALTCLHARPKIPAKGRLTPDD